jgi:hypothetical protein
MKKLRKIPLTVFIALLASSLLLFLSGCSLIKSAELRALDDATSVLQLTTGQEVSRSLRDKDWGFSGPIYPQIIILYEPSSNHTKKDVYDEIVTILEKNDWRKDRWNTVTVPEHFSGSVQQGQFEISGSVNIDPNRNLVIVIMRIY